ncbi:hypothetical protein Xcel_2368 [Xylanimonas cellulosilytica DSM 15894]|uniref:Heparan-alpha-glucosaminide N-acetyltransferase catalytic domain-containing protein n=1 Tax=Xylanimonas cellulosilytica (strain DSM 15894 / JCM 12276 / CECT 5975 / KCTC 9989 / LMG 20990 / NBRC 107835 / XIL07) TaxID=446471 RepID=D1BVR5_XYLCX|nr:heparan-alpha-glucosaminide N-acetyltransferase domain-containing protein [Xylanimonas cellulosilytica]ACZ31384.1 hypothetical protein Xcel_2368 [Xylanimonas cellulosilytica DSM 15894]
MPAGRTRTPHDWSGRVWSGRLAGRLLGGPGRVPGVDVARGIAVLGMFTAHVGVTSDDWSRLDGWLGLAHGRSSILFATVAGLSLALVTGRAHPLDGEALVRARLRVLVRAACLLAVGALLDALGTRVYLILGFYAVYFALAVPVLRWRVHRLVTAAAIVAVVGPPLAYWGPEALARAGLRLPRDGDGAVTHFLLSGHYPAVVWMAYLLVGLAIGRSAALTSARTRAGLVVGGAAGWWLASAASAVLLQPAGGVLAVRAAVTTTTSTSATGPLAWVAPWPPVAGLFLAGPHDDTLLEVIGSGGFAVMVIGLCLCVGRVGARVLAPLAAVGSMALTVYTVQIIAIWRWDLLDVRTNGPLAWMVLISLAAATAWRALLGRGPLERLVARLANAAAAGPRRTGDAP